MFGTVYSPEGAAEIGYLDRLTEPDRLIEAALHEAKQLAKLGGPAYELTKQRLRERTIQYIRDTLAEDMARLKVPTG